jgi:hypothetical protein
MDLDTDTVIRLGDACERFLGDDDFNTITKLFEAKQVTGMLSTKRDQPEVREELFATLQAVRDFITFMAELARQKAELQEPTIVDTTDDPRVHDIFDFED